MDIQSFTFAHYGEERDVNATEDDLKICELVAALLPEDDCRLLRRSDQYLTFALGDYDIIRFKWTDRARWIILPLVEAKAKKHYLETIEDIKGFKDEIIKSYDLAKKWG